MSEFIKDLLNNLIICYEVIEYGNKRITTFSKYKMLEKYSLKKMLDKYIS